MKVVNCYEVHGYKYFWFITVIGNFVTEVVYLFQVCFGSPKLVYLIRH